jgi:23S rRNA (cytosine1962-C5)-methyltransferase
VRSGHPWVFRDDVAGLPADAPNGAEAEVVDEAGRFVGRGLLSLASNIVCRIYSRQPEPLDREFFRRRLMAAHMHRRRLGLPSAETDSFRLVYAEGDLLPGLTVDRYADYLVVQTPTAAMDLRKPMLVELLAELFQPQGICERNDMAVRQQEGLPRLRGWLSGKPAEQLQIRENGVLYQIDPLGAMKTGHFFDQRENRGLLMPICQDARVLDMFCSSGGFGLMAARAGARSVLSVDSSQPAIAAARANALSNAGEGVIEHLVGDGFETLRRLDTEGRQFDVVVLDPPAFAKRRSHLDHALRAYKQINLRAVRMLPVGGWLLTCSCSYQVDRSGFRAVLLEAAADARCVLRVTAEQGAAADHPALLNVPETDYLKCLLACVVEKF